MALAKCRVPFAVIVCVLAAARAIGAQQFKQIRGLVRDTTTGAPVSGAVISLFDDSGKVTTRTIADASGHFLVTHLVGARTLQALRIGFRPSSRLLNETRRTRVSSASPSAPGRDTLVDVSGTLWLRPSAAALESIDFRYTGLESGQPCEVAIWVNGAPMDVTFDINSIPPKAIYGIEVYHASDTPAQFTAVTTFTNACGSLVIWTK